MTHTSQGTPLHLSGDVMNSLTGREPRVVHFASELCIPRAHAAFGKALQAMTP